LQPWFYCNTNKQVNMMDAYLQPSEIIDCDHPAIRELAGQLAFPGGSLATAKRCFEWVRDEIRHSCDFQQGPVTCRASDVLQHRTGYCYAKSHLLAALLRANQIPAGLCYQRLSIDDLGAPYSLHGFNAIHLPIHGWYRVDSRGNRPGIDAQFMPPVERLAFPLQYADEFEIEEILTEPLDCVVNMLRRCGTWQEVRAALPDLTLDGLRSMKMSVRTVGSK
jgi:transglutaminase-like putative cysteine protease